jgi:Spy/CpxP family protein refolding chaperone
VEVIDMMLARNLALLVALAIVPASVVACGGTVEQPQTTASAGTKAPIGTTTHGFVKVVGDALGEVPLRAEQRTELEKLASEADARHATLTDGRKELMAAIADQVESGTIDRPALQPKLDRIAADMEKVRPADHAALARVHAILDAEQRSAFVDALEEKLEDKRGHGGHRARMGGDHGMKGFGHMNQLAGELKLTDEQRAQIKDAMMEGRKEWRTHAEGESQEGRRHDGKHGKHGKHGFKGRFHGGKQALEAFRSDQFDPNALPQHPAMKDKAAKGATRMLGMAEKILPLLTPEQRKIAADKIRAMATSRH